MPFLFAILLGIIVAVIAAGKGRTAIGWFFIGFFFPIIGLILVLVMPNLHEEKNRLERGERENRMLREKLRQEQLRLESLRQHAESRLDAHDLALKMDTRESAPPLLQSRAALPPQLTQPDPHGVPIWFYAQAGSQCGPVTEAQLRSLIAQGVLTGYSLIWQDGMGDWMPANDVSPFTQLFT